VEQEHLLYQIDMAHYSLIDNDNVVINVIVGSDESDEMDWEAHYSSVTGLTCKRTSYNTFAGEHRQGGVPFRKNYGSVGYTYDEDRDAFIPPKPFDSWVLDEDTCIWQSPVPPPILTEDDIANGITGSNYFWNEETLNWEYQVSPDDIVAQAERELAEES